MGEVITFSKSNDPAHECVINLSPYEEASNGLIRVDYFRGRVIEGSTYHDSVSDAIYLLQQNCPYHLIRFSDDFDDDGSAT